MAVHLPASVKNFCRTAAADGKRRLGQSTFLRHIFEALVAMAKMNVDGHHFGPELSADFRKITAAFVHEAEITVALMEMHAVYNGRQEYHMTAMRPYLANMKTVRELRASAGTLRRPVIPVACPRPPSTPPTIGVRTAAYYQWRNQHREAFTAWDRYQSDVEKYNAGIKAYTTMRFDKMFENDMR